MILFVKRFEGHNGSEGVKTMMMNNSSVIRLDDKIDLSRIRHIAFDMDGTIYRGGTLFPFTISVFKQLESLGIGYTWLTNNSSVSAKDYLSKIVRLGLPGTAENIYTSSLATVDYLKKNFPDVRRIFLLGTKSLHEELVSFGYELIDDSNCVANRPDSLEDRPNEPDLVLVAFDTALEYSRLCRCVYWIQQGKPYLATHPDLVCPTDLPTVLVDCGAICALIESITGRRPQAVPGKPDPAMLTGLMNRYDLKPDEIMMVGDRLYTDLEMARRADVTGVLVLTGEATLEDLEKSDLTPELVLENIAVLAELLKQALSA